MNKRRLRIIFGSIIVIVAAAILIIMSMSSRNNKQYSKLEYPGGSVPITYTWPGEFDKQQAIWMEWPSATYNEGSRPVNPVTISIIKAIAPYERVNIISESVDEILQIKNLLKTNGYTGTNVHCYTINHLSIWARDVGPVFVKDNLGRLSVVDFGFNNYSRDGSQYYINTESQVDRLTAQALGLPVISTSLISEGGAIESNGRGTMMVPESVALTRNPQMSKQQIENEYKRVLGVKKVIWLKNGLAEDDHITSGHINEVARFASPNTILLAQVLPGDRYASWASEASYLRLEENYNILKNSTDQDGKPFKIIRIPMPPTLYQEANAQGGEIPVRSYLNYAVVNGAVIMQTYWNPSRSNTLKTTEEQVKATFRSVFPGRNIIGIDAENVNLWGGGIHCITQHMPAN